MAFSRLTLVPAALLAACGSPQDDPAPDRRPPARPPAAAAPERLAELPEPYRDRWALVPADCEPGRADAKGLMTVQARRLTFYESRAVPDAIVALDATHLTLRLRFSGEGQEWTHDTALTLSDGGRTLTRDEKGSDTGVLTYRRCAA